MADYQNIIVDATAPVATVTINRPTVLNALNDPTVTELEAAFAALENDARIRVVILTGSGEKAFVAGADINELKVCDVPGGIQKSLKGQALLNRIESSRLIVIAAINGFALGGGCEIAMACDIRLAADNARLGQPEVNLGIIPGYGGSQRLPRLVGKGKAKQLILTGDMINATEAHRIGLVEEVYPAADLLNKAKEMATKIAAKGPVAIATAKRCINFGLDVDLRTGLEYEATQFGVVCASDDKTEGCTAFLEKRPAQFKGK
ncbi:MAG: enoyl-CoA hydratase/isomerase family protein [candidate division Zixibacteria bacterium]|nr:enoyl-CoA hydratase/isomerase family protein [candidate division Zixibacteria bacterium]